MRSEPDILVVLYKSVCFVKVSIGEISFSLLERPGSWGIRAVAALLCSSLTRSNFRFKAAGETMNFDREVAPPVAKG